MDPEAAQAAAQEQLGDQEWNLAEIERAKLAQVQLVRQLHHAVLPQPVDVWSADGCSKHVSSAHKQLQLSGHLLASY